MESSGDIFKFVLSAKGGCLVNNGTMQNLVLIPEGKLEITNKGVIKNCVICTDESCTIKGNGVLVNVSTAPKAELCNICRSLQTTPEGADAKYT